VAAKGLDAEVLSESPKSVLYRIEYWQATAALIADHPLFGVGPGNFKERYVNHKLPQASETVSDPHNFLLEVWSTAGTPALLALLGMMVATAWQLGRRSPTVESVATPEREPQAKEELTIGEFAVYAGAVLGLLLGGILGFVVFDPLETTNGNAVNNPNAGFGVPIIWLASFVSFVVCFVGLKDWVQDGELPRSAVVIALVALLVNLLAAGAAIYPGVVNAAWLLWAIALQRGETPSPANQGTAGLQPWISTTPNVTKVIGLAGACLFAAALISCYFTEYSPVLNGQMKLLQAVSARDERNTSEALAKFDEAIAIDPWAPLPRRMLAELRLQIWRIASPKQRAWGPFLDAMEGYEKTSPHHFTMHEDRGNWLLIAARETKNRDYLQMAAEAYEAAVKRYPNSNILHAQLALVYAEQERIDDARREAEEAARLDALCPHIEQKLERRPLFDPEPARYTTTEGGKQKPLKAGEIVAQIRNLPPSEKPELKEPGSDQPAERPK
jgi:tetratricopeptide (TPR) repeat protein